MVDEYFTALGHAVEQAWSARGRDELHFAEAAVHALTEVEVPTTLDGASILRRTASPAIPLPAQVDLDASFGQPPVTLYRGTDFFIAALFWFDGSPAVHHHQFSGAFRVLQGSSIHVPHRFELTERLGHRLALGTLHATGAELLRVGDVRPIPLGEDGIHSLFHLERPSVTIVVRTHGEPTGSSLQDYLMPGLAYDPFFRDEALRRPIQALHSLYAIDRDAALDAAVHLVGDLDAFRAFYVTLQWFAGTSHDERAEALVAAVGERHPQLREILPHVFAERQREHSLLARRSTLRDPRHRAFLACLLVLRDRERRDAVLEALQPALAPGQYLVEVLHELAAPEMRGRSGLALDEAELALLDAALLEPDGVSSDALEQLSRRINRSDVLGALFR